MNKSDNNNWLILGGVAFIALLLFFGYRVMAVSVGPVKVEFDRKNNTTTQSSAPESQLPTVQSQSQQQPQPAAPSAPIGIENPSGVVMSSETIISDGYILNFVSVTPNPNFSEFLRVKLVVTNYSANSRIFRFVRNSVSMRDDIGTSFSNENPADEIFRSVQVEMPIQEPITFISTLGFDWENTTLLSFKGPISSSASKLYIDFNGFGPFSGFSIEVDI